MTIRYGSIPDEKHVDLKKEILYFQRNGFYGWNSGQIDLDSIQVRDKIVDVVFNLTPGQIGFNEKYNIVCEIIEDIHENENKRNSRD